MVESTKERLTRVKRALAQLAAQSAELHRLAGLMVAPKSARSKPANRVIGKKVARQLEHLSMETNRPGRRLP
jgi:hypothetical protein